MKKFLRAMEILCRVVVFLFIGYVVYIPLSADVDLRLQVARDVGYYSTQLCWALVGIGFFTFAAWILKLIVTGRMYYIIMNGIINLTRWVVRLLFRQTNTTKRETVMTRALEDLVYELGSKKIALEKRRAKRYE